MHGYLFLTMFNLNFVGWVYKAKEDELGENDVIVGAQNTQKPLLVYINDKPMLNGHEGFEERSSELNYILFGVG